VGTVVTATVNGNLCGETAVVEHNNQLVYALQVHAFANDGCGLLGDPVILWLGGHQAAPAQPWDNHRAWYQTLQAVPPPQPPAWMTITRTGSNNLLLNWGIHPANTGYEVWRSQTPYFIPSLPGSTRIFTGPVNQFTDLNSTGNPVINYYYLVQGINSLGQKSAVSPRTGEFDFMLQPEP
jgi:hypothetical protein